MKTFILIMWFGTVHGGPSMLEFETMEKCDAVRQVLLAAYVGDQPEEPGWGTNGYAWRAAQKTKCFEVNY